MRRDGSNVCPGAHASGVTGPMFVQGLMHEA